MKFYPKLFEEEPDYTDEQKAGLRAEEAASDKLENQKTITGPDGKEINMKELMFEVQSARTAIVSQDPYFGPFVHELRIIYTWLVPTMATDGVRLFINPAFGDYLTWLEKIFVIIHEIMHCVLLHVTRRNGRDSNKWNKACDYEVNNLIVDTMGSQKITKEFVTSKRLGALFNEEYFNMPVEEIYEKIKDMNFPPRNKSQGFGGGGSGSGAGGLNDPNAEKIYKSIEEMDKGGIGTIIDIEDGKEIAKRSGYKGEEMGDATDKIDQKWHANGGQLMNELKKSLAAGKGDGSRLLTKLQNIHFGEVDWKNKLRQYVGTALSPEKQFRVGNRRYMEGTFFRYGQRTKMDALNNILVCVDTSGSVSDQELARLLGEINGIIFSKKVAKITVIYFSGSVDEKNVQLITKMNAPIIPPPDPNRGGTDFQAALDWIKDKFKNNVKLCIFLTDGGDSIPVRPPYAHNFIWVIIANPGFTSPWGKKILLKKKK